MLERRGFARRHRLSSPSFSLSLLPTASSCWSCGSLVTACTCSRMYRVCIYTVLAEARAPLLTHRKRDPDIRRLHVRTYTLPRRHSCGLHLILLEATDAPISVRVSFVIRENVNQSPGPRRLLLLRASSLLLSILASVHTCARANTNKLAVLSRPIRVHVCIVRV